MPPSVSIVIPVFREPEELLDDLALWIDKNSSDKIEWLVSIADDEESLSYLKNSVFSYPESAEKNLYLLIGERGRARQMNRGLEHARGDVVAFLHADTRLETRGLNELLELSINKKAPLEVVSWGCFKPSIDEAGVLFRIAEWWGFIRTRLLGIPFGDQCIFARKSVFQSVCGFDESVDFMEDLHLSKTLTRKFGRPAIMSGSAVTSSRLWNKNKGFSRPFRQSLKNFFAFVLFQAGIPRELIRQWYHR